MLKIEKRITVGNVIIIVGILIGFILWYAGVSAHVNDTSIHISSREALEQRLERIESDTNYLRKRMDEVHPPTP